MLIKKERFLVEDGLKGIRNLDDISKEGYKYHHTSMTQGYVPVSVEGIILKYSGKFGKGFKFLWHNSNSTNYCHCSYYVK